jgi:hypothetical protein
LFGHRFGVPLVLTLKPSIHDTPGQRRQAANAQPFNSHHRRSRAIRAIGAAVQFAPSAQRCNSRHPRDGKILHVPSSPPTVSRRRVLLGAATLALLGAASTACGAPPPPPEVDELAAALTRARSDSQLANDAAAAARGAVVPALTAVADQRAAHAQALIDELVRMRGNDAPTSTTSSTTAQPAAAPTVKDVVAALRESADTATELAGKLTGYRAGLLASIAAACTAAYSVALEPPGSPQ